MSSGVRLHYSLHGGTRHHDWPRARGVGWLLVIVLAMAGLAVVFEHPGRHSTALSRLNSDAIVTAAAHSQAAASAPVSQPIAPDEASGAAAAVAAATAQNQATAWSVAVYDLNKGAWLVQQNSGQVMPSASLYKLYAAYGLAQTIPFGSWNGRQVNNQSIYSCADKMLRLSDNDCGDALAGMIGWGTIDTFDRAHGFMNTRLNLPSGPVTTADDTAQYLIDLASNRLFAPDVTNFVMNSLSQQRYRSAIPAGCSGCSVANKTGLDGNVAHDAAIVDDGRLKYVVVIMSEGGSYQKIANIERALQTALSADE